MEWSSSRGVDTRDRLGLRDLAPRLLAEGRSLPLCTPFSWVGSCLLAADGAIGLPSKPFLRRGPDCPPTIVVPRRADPGGPPPSGPVPAPSLLSKRSTGSSTVGVAAPASIARASTLALSDVSQAALTSSGTPHDDAIPVDLALLHALARLRENLDDPCEGPRSRREAVLESSGR